MESDLITARGQVASQQEVICSLQHQLAVSQHHLQQQQHMAQMFVPESGVASGRHARELEQAGRPPGGALAVRLHDLCRGGCMLWLLTSGMIDPPAVLHTCVRWLLGIA